MTKLGLTALGLGALAVSLGACAADPSGGAAGGRRLALLVGCTKYPSLPAKWRLEGPANDIALWRRLLRERFGFKPEHIKVLSEAAGGDDAPTRAHIEREFRRLAREARPGDQVFVSLSGHGSQQPEPDPPDPDYPEPDGLNEVFLPSDVSSAGGKGASIPNGIADDDLRKWVKAITDTGASLWVVADCCHSGTMLRGADDEVTRQVPAEELIAPEVLERARRRAAARGGQTRGAGGEVSPPVRLTRASEHLAAVYASQASEVTLEKSFPDPEAPKTQKKFGLLSYTLCQILTQAPTALTYRELVQRVQTRYLHDGRSWPTPLVEGSDLDHEVFGIRDWPGRSRFVLTRDATGTWKVNGGALHGLTDNSVLAVRLPGAAAPAGHVRVRRADPLESVVQPCAYAEAAERADLPADGSAGCEVVYLDFGSLQLKVAVQPAAAGQGQDWSKDGAPQSLDRPDTSATRRLDQQLARAAADVSLFQVVADPRQADWLVRSVAGKVYLLPAQGVKQTRDGHAETAMFGPLAVADPAAELRGHLDRIARAQNLVKLATDASGEMVRDTTAGPVSVEVELVKFRDRSDRKGEVVRRDAARPTVHDGDHIAFRVHNRGRVAVDVTLLFVDSDFGISVIWPDPRTVTDNRILPDRAVTVGRSRVSSGKTKGLEHVVIIAVQGEGAPVDFSCLAQPTLERAKVKVAARGGGPDALASPLGQLFRNALYGGGVGRRGLGADDVDKYALKLLSLHTLDRAAKGGPSGTGR